MSMLPVRHDDDDDDTGIVNRKCKRYKLKELREDQFKYLIFVLDLKSP